MNSNYPNLPIPLLNTTQKLEPWEDGGWDALKQLIQLDFNLADTHPEERKPLVINVERKPWVEETTKRVHKSGV